MRWRIEKEILSGKGQFECGNKHCNNHEDLQSWEVNFTYIEFDEKKNALVKLRLCPECSPKLNYHSKKRLAKRNYKKEKSTKKSKTKKSKERSSESEDSNASEGSDVQTPDKKQRIEEPKIDAKTEPSQSQNCSSKIWEGKSSALVNAEKTLNDELDEFIDDLLL